MLDDADLTMRALLVRYPGAQRALFRNFHIGGCASCGFDQEETLAQVCARNDGLDPALAMEKILEAHAEEAKIFIAAKAAHEVANAKFLDVRTREEFDAVHIAGSEFFSQESLQSLMATWPKETLIVVVDHTGTRSLDAAAYLAGHGFTQVRALRGGIDAWSVEVDSSIPRYTTE